MTHQIVTILPWQKIRYLPLLIWLLENKKATLHFPLNLPKMAFECVTEELASLQSVCTRIRLKTVTKNCQTCVEFNLIVNYNLHDN